MNGACLADDHAQTLGACRIEIDCGSQKLAARTGRLFGAIRHPSQDRNVTYAFVLDTLRLCPDEQVDAVPLSGNLYHRE